MMMKKLFNFWQIFFALIFTVCVGYWAYLDIVSIDEKFNLSSTPLSFFFRPRAILGLSITFIVVYVLLWPLKLLWNFALDRVTEVSRAIDKGRS